MSLADRQWTRHPPGPAATGHHRATVVSLGLATFLLIDTMRVWLPSVTTIFGSAGGTPPERMGLFALAWMAVSALVLPISRRVHPANIALAAAAIAVFARLVVQTASGGSWQLYSSSVAVTALLGWVVATALRGVDSPSAAAGVGIGLAAATVGHTLLRAVDLTWQRGLLPWLLLLAAGAWLIVTTARSGNGRPGSAGLWFLFGPAIFMAGMVTAAPTRAWAGADWAEPRWGPHLLVTGAVLGAAAAWRGGLGGGRTWLALLVLGVAGPAAVAVRDPAGLAWWVPVAQAAAAFALGAAVGRAGSRTTNARPPTRGVCAFLGLLALVTLIFGYFAAYDMALPVANIWMLPVAAAFVALGAVGPARTAGSPVTWRAAISVSLIVGVVTAVIVQVSAPPLAAWGKGEFPVRLVTYNIRYGFSADGRFAPAELAEVVRSQQPDLVLLQEVDRAWFLNGGHDVLDQLARRTGMRYVFAPSSDAVWGDAILSRLPLDDVRFHRLSPAGVPTRAGTLSAVVSLGSEGRLAVMVTHLHEGADGVSPVQVAQVAADARALTDGGLPLVLAGDFNLEPGDPLLSTFEPLLLDGLAASRPAATWPSTGPTKQIDHVFVTEDLEVGEVEVPRSTASDHLPVAVTISKRDS